MNAHALPHCTAALMAEQTRLAFAIADREAVSAIEYDAPKVTPPDSLETWLDIHHLLSPDEQPTVFIDMNTQVLAYARMRGLIVHHPKRPTLVRIVHRP